MPINHEVIPRGDFLQGFDQTMSLQCRGFTWALHMEKSISLLFPGPRGDVVANDWCINGPKTCSPVDLKLVGWFCCFTSQVNSYGHCGTVSSPNHTFSWAGLNKRLTSNSCTYFRL